MMNPGEQWLRKVCPRFITLPWPTTAIPTYYQNPKGVGVLFRESVSRNSVAVAAY